MHLKQPMFQAPTGWAPWQGAGVALELLSVVSPGGIVGGRILSAARWNILLSLRNVPFRGVEAPKVANHERRGLGLECVANSQRSKPAPR